MESTTSQNLAMMLREGTQHVHEMAENTGFLRDFLQGHSTLDDYAVFLGNLYFVYAAMEEVFTAHREHPALAPLFFPQLAREASIARDLQTFWGEAWKERAEREMRDATRVYARRLREIGSIAPHLLVAHIYTRYLGDLSGGLFLRKLLRERFNLQEDGLEFYNFDLGASPGAFKKNYRAALDELPVSPTLAQEIVEEARLAFFFNMNLSWEIAFKKQPTSAQAA